MDKSTIISVTNRDNGVVGYTVPDLGIRRIYHPRETKDVTFEELLSVEKEFLKSELSNSVDSSDKVQ